ncbi:MAG: type II toxin-antitoxin system RelE/ParE family toxin [Deltaproteobacteria bacterium]|nr:type II toxin-antitoxin system RelE/ParE family toxin [Deltaproteobacteria bacterium]
MPNVEVIFYQEQDGSSPVRKWVNELPNKIRAKARVRIERLAELGHELRRPEADYLRDDIYELRWRVQSVNYRILYFFHGREVVVLAQGLTKEREVPPGDIDLAIKRKKEFSKNPKLHTYIIGD